MAKEKKKPTGDYPVGYCKTPDATKFKPGNPGNPKGNPKPIKSATEEFVEEGNRTTAVKQPDGRIVRLSWRALGWRAAYKAAAQGNVSAMRLVFGHLFALPTIAAGGPAPLTAEEIEMLQNEIDLQKLLKAAKGDRDDDGDDGV